MAEFEEIEVVQPSDGETVWRYMDLAPYLSTLKSKSIYFSPLSTFDDPFEGASPYSWSFESILTHQWNSGEIDKQFLEATKLSSRRIRSVVRDVTCVCCWYLSEHESDAMWRLYSHSNASVAIKTNCEKLRAQMPKTAQFGKMRYIDFSLSARPPGPFSYDSTFLKRKAFEHEKEMRIKLDASDDLKIAMSAPVQTGGDARGKSISVDLSALVECVVVNPLAPQWLVDCIRDVTQRYGFEFEIRHSTMAEMPAY